MTKNLLLLLLCLGQCLLSAQNLKVLNYHLAEGITSKRSAFNDLQQYMKRLDVDVAAFQEVDGISEEGLRAYSKKWAHPYATVLQMDQCAIALTSKYPLENVQKIEAGLRHGCLYAEVEGVGIYNTQLTSENAKARAQEAEQIAQSVARNGKESIVLLGALNSYSPQDSALYNQRWRRVEKENRYDRDVIMRLAGYQRERNYKVLHQLQSAGLYDILAERRGMNMIVENTYPTQANADGMAEYEQHRFDYILCNEGLVDKCEQIQLLRDKTTHKLSQHYPVLATFKLGTAVK